MEKYESYMVIAVIAGKQYLTKLEATSYAAAENRVLEKSFCGKHEYGVSACQSFKAEDAKYDTFIYQMLASAPVSVDELSKIIEKNNERIKEKQAIQEEIDKFEKKRCELCKELSEIEEQYKELTKALYAI